MKAKSKKPGLGFMVDGKWQKFEWSNLAKLTARILSHLPTEPPLAYSGPGLLGPAVPEPINPESAFPFLDRYLEMVAGISEFIQRYARVRAHKLGEHDSNALVTAWAHLDFIHKARYVPPDIKRELPINIAAIAQTVSTASALKAKPGELRPTVDHRGALRKAVDDAVRANEDDSTIYILNVLKGSADPVVKEMKDERVYFWNGKKLDSVGYDRFENICVDARKAKARGRRTLIKKPSTG